MVKITLNDKVNKLKEKSKAKNTQDKYQGDWLKFIDYCKNKSSFTTSVVSLKFKNNTKYYYYILKCNKNKMMDLARYTVGLGHIKTVTLKEFKIKIVSPDEQQKIVDYCDNLQMMIDKLEENIENNNILMKTILENKLKQQSGESPNKNYTINGNNYIKQKVPGDGHCFFHAVALYLERPIEELRDEVATYMLDNQDDFINHYEADEHNGITYEEFVEQIRSTDEWADNLVIQAIQQVIDRPVQVYQDNDGELIKTQNTTIENENEPIMVLYNGTNHYDALVQVEDTPEEEENNEVEELKPKNKSTPKKKKKYTEEELLEMTNKDLIEICKKLEVKGSRIKNNNVKRILEKQ